MGQHLFKLSMALVVTVLFIYGNDINRAVKKRVKRYNFALRVMIFVLVCSFGFGLAAVLSATLLTRILLHVDSFLLAPLVILLFVLIGILAERKNHI